MNNIEKIVMGTVQFGMPYGINNSSGVPGEEEIKNIFDLAFSLGVGMLDTAFSYGNAEEKIGEFANNRFKVITKFSSGKTPSELLAELKCSLHRARSGSFYGYLAHNADMLLAHPDLWKTLLQTKEDKLIEKIGYSLYTCEQLEKLLELNLVPDLVQLPYNLLDRKFETFFPRLKKLGIEIHARSVFLQGLFFMDLGRLPVKLQGLKPELKQIGRLASEYELPLHALALCYALNNTNIDGVVIGVDNILQLKKNIEATGFEMPLELVEKINKINVKFRELLSPINWN